MSFQISGAWLSHPGKERPHNEDSLLIAGEVLYSRKEESGVAVSLRAVGAGIAAVADGIGGGEAGELASRTALERLAGWKGATADSLVSHLCDTNRHFYEMMRQNPALHGMGTTVTGLAWGESGCFAFNVGDSRVYRVNSGYLQQITEDHSLAELLAKSQGKSYGDAEKVRPSDQHVLMQALGGRQEFREITPQIVELRVKESADFLLCSDGLTDMLDLDSIEACLGDPSDPASALTRLKERVMDAGAQDNLTMVWVTLSRTDSLMEKSV